MSLAKQLFMCVDDFAHEHLPPYIRVQPVDGKAGVHLLACLVVEVWLQVNEILLLANPAVDLIKFQPPLGVGVRMEGVFDVARVDGHQGQENGADVVGLAYSPVKIVGNGHKFRGCIVAKSILDKDGNVLDDEMPGNEKVDGATDILQNFPARVGFSEARYDTFGLVKLRNYANPAKDVIYLPPRSKITD